MATVTKVKCDGLNAEVSFEIKNISSVDGSEVAQVYVGECSPVVYRPLKELKGWVKVAVKAGKSVKACVKLDSRAFAYYSVADDGWRVNDGVYKIYVGASSRDLCLCHTLTVKDGKII